MSIVKTDGNFNVHKICEVNVVHFDICTLLNYRQTCTIEIIQSIFYDSFVQFCPLIVLQKQSTLCIAFQLSSYTVHPVPQTLHRGPPAYFKSTVPV